ncbi:MAG: hypothetical protein KAJ51_11065 [Thermoplasmata archaeon]|nr:hypothetical protein [Thermoplasmata archaeon]
MSWGSDFGMTGDSFSSTNGTSTGKPPVKKGIIFAGVIVIAIGLIFIALGSVEREEAGKIDTKTTEESWFGDEHEVTDMDKLADKNQKNFNGIAMIMFGVFICIAGGIGIASQFSSRTHIGYHSPIFTRVDDRPKRTATKHKSPEPPEKIRIKCPACKYLDTEDATFCSKCGSKLY